MKNRFAVTDARLKLRLLLFSSILTIFLSCKNYTVAVDSFREQMTQPGNEQLRAVEINNPAPYMYTNIRYEANSIDYITVIDKKGNPVRIENSPRLEMRVTRKDGKRYILLFDTVIVENDTLKGARSRLLQHLRREIPMNDIAKIQIQDSGKVYKYQ